MYIQLGKYCLLLTLLLNSVNLYAKEKLIWVTDDKTELANFLNDVNISIGTDTSKLVIQSLLKTYDIDILLAQVPRINLLLTALPNVCTSNRIKTKQRAKENIFSTPVNIFPSIRLYFLHDTRYRQGVDIFHSLLNDNGELISLPLLFNALPEFVLGVSKGRSFGESLDLQVGALAPKNRLTRAGIGRYEALERMLFKKRIDFTLQFPTELKLGVDDYPQEVNVSSLAIAENSQFILGHIGCSQSELGKKVIKHSNEILQKLYRQPNFYQAHSRYLNATDLADFDQYYEQVYQTPVPLKPSSLKSVINNEQ